MGSLGAPERLWWATVELENIQRGEGESSTGEDSGRRKQSLLCIGRWWPSAVARRLGRAGPAKGTVPLQLSPLLATTSYCVQGKGLRPCSPLNRAADTPALSGIQRMQNASMIN